MRTIAILVDTYTWFQRQMIDPITERLNAHGFGVLVVAGRELKPDIRSSQPTYNDANRIFSVAKGYNVAGFVLLTGCIGHNLNRAELDEFIRGFTHAPVVSLGVDVPSANSVTSRSRPGMRLLMEHVTSDSSRKNFVFIRGFKNDKDSMEREMVFRQVLVERGLHINERCFLTGNYIAVDAYNALDALLSEHQQVDAVISANDEMAVAAIRVLKKHGYRVPEDVVVTGFDDSSLARDASPPLTSVHQPIEEQVIATVDSLMSMIRNGERVQTIHAPRYFTGVLKIRESSISPGSVQVVPDIAFDGSLEQALDHFIQTFIDEKSSIIEPDNVGGYDVLFYMMSQQLQGQTTWFDTFFDELDKDDNFGKRDLGWWREFENLLSELTLRISHAACFSQYMPELIQMQRQLSRFTWSLKNNLHFDVERGSLLQSRLQAMLTKCHRKDEVYEVLNVYFEKYCVRRSFLVMYKSMSGDVDCVARLVYAYRAEPLYRQDIDESAQQQFESRDILPTGLLHELAVGTLVLNPLYVDEVQFGYLLIDPIGAGVLNYEYMSYALSNTLKRLSHTAIAPSKSGQTP